MDSVLIYQKILWVHVWEYRQIIIQIFHPCGRLPLNLISALDTLAGILLMGMKYSLGNQILISSGNGLWASGSTERFWKKGAQAILIEEIVFE